MGVKVQLLDIWSRLTQYDKKVGIIKNGADNAYAERIERYINNSVTAKTASNVMASYIGGKGFGDNNSIVVGKKGTTLLKFSQKVAKNIAKQRGVFIHVNYNMNYNFDSFDVLPYTHCRLGKKDDNKYNGKIGVSDKFTSDKIKESDIVFINVFNPNKDVINSQVEKAGGWDNYKGQILYVNLDDEYNYALSTIDAVQYDCDSEGQASLFKNKSLRKGFFGKTLIITKPLSGNIEDYDTKEEYYLARSERQDFKDTIDNFIGAENVGGALHFELENESDDIQNAIKFENISSDIDDKLFEYTETSVFKNILTAFNSMPDGMVRSAESMFGNSGESLKEMQRIYQNNTSQERMELEQVIQRLMRNFVKPVDVELIPLIELEEEAITEVDVDVLTINERRTNQGLEALDGGNAIYMASSLIPSIEIEDK